MSFISSSSPIKAIKTDNSSFNPIKDGNSNSNTNNLKLFSLGEDSQHFKTQSPRKTDSSIGERMSHGSPLKNTNLSPVIRNETESLYSSNPNNYFSSSPGPKVMVTEAIKVGSGKKSKDLSYHSPNRSYNENSKDGIVVSPNKVQFLETYE